MEERGGNKGDPYAIRSPLGWTHYQLALPWREREGERERVPNLPDNRILGERRLKLLNMRCLQDAELFGYYKATIGDYISKGLAKRVPEDDLAVDVKPLWYPPHHPVFHPNKPGKTRVVCDCGVRFREVCLNDQLLSGPDLTSSIVVVLTRFRQEQVVFAVDVEAMFHQVRVSRERRL